MINKKNYFCPLCQKEFGNKKDNYHKHLNKTGCGIGIIKLEEIKQQIEEMKQQNEVDILRLKEENDKLVDEDKKIKEENEKLKEENESLKKQAIVYKNTYNTDNSTNITNNFILQINNFDNTKCEVVIQNLLKYIGKSIYLNNEKPENHNIYVADKNRQIVKIFNNGIWQSKNMTVIDKIIDNIVK